MSWTMRWATLSLLALSLVANATFYPTAYRGAFSLHAAGTSRAQSGVRQAKPDVATDDWSAYMMGNERSGFTGGSTDWPMFQGTLEHSGFNGSETILNPTTAPQLNALLGLVGWGRACLESSYRD